MVFGSWFLLGCFVCLQVMSSVMTQQKVRMCYFTGWAQYRFGRGRFMPSDIDPHLCTHIICAFAHIDTVTNSIENVDSDDAQYHKQITAMKETNPGLKVLLAVGGANQGTADFETVASSKTRTMEFVNNAIGFLRRNDFDGLDVDWEFPTEKTRSDFRNFIQLLSVGFKSEGVRSEKDKLELTMSVSGNPATVATSYGPEDLVEFVDHVILMGYDMWGTWMMTLGHHSPLSIVIPDHFEQGRFSMKKLVDEWIKHGAPKNKLVLGLSTYGRTGLLQRASQHSPGQFWARHMGTAGPYTRAVGYLSYYEICENLKDQDWSSDYSETGNVPYAWSTSTLQYVCYDDTRSFRAKAEYIMEEGLAGAMFWTLDYDDFKGEGCNEGRYPLLRQVKAVLDGDTGMPDPAAGVSKKQQAPVVLAQAPKRTTLVTTTKTPQTTTTTTTTTKPTTTTTVTTTTAILRPASVHKTTAEACPPFKCPSLFGFFPDLADCSHFHQCAFARPFDRKCPPPLLFDPRYRLCNWPAVVQCQIKC